MNYQTLIQNVMTKLIEDNQGGFGYFDLREYPQTQSKPDLVVDCTVEITHEEAEAIRWLIRESDESADRIAHRAGDPALPESASGSAPDDPAHEGGAH